MKTQHLFEEGYYLIRNKSVAKCFLFKDEYDCNRFKEKIDICLSPLCDVLAYGFLQDEFQMVVRLKSREVFEAYFQEKYEKVIDRVEVIPETTYIFAQAMSNLQSGYAKWFNYKYERDGGLMAGRYMRELVENEKDLDTLIEEINGLVKKVKRNSIWTFRRKEPGFVMNEIMNSSIRSSKVYYDGEKEEGISLKAFRLKKDVYLRGHFLNLPPKAIEDYNSTKKMQNLIAFMFLKYKQ